MRNLTNVISTAKTLAPKIIASPLQTPQIIRQHISAHALSVMESLFDLSADDQSSTPTTPAPPPAFGNGVIPNRPQAGNGLGIGNHRGVTPPPSQPYVGMTKAPAPPVYVGMTKAPAQQPYVVMSKAPTQQPYINLPKAPQNTPVEGLQRRPVGSGAAPGPAMPSINNIEQLSLPDHHRHDDERLNVRYIDDLEIRLYKYRVEVEGTISRRQQVLDTGAIKDQFKKRREMPVPPGGKERAGLGIAVFGKDRADNDARFMNLCYEWGYQGMIWVCVKEDGWPEPVFYSHVGKIGRFHHSSFNAGGSVIGAGEWIVHQGRLRKISANSGHYRPPYEYFRRAVQFMRKAWQPETVVLLWNVRTNKYDEVPVQQFVNTPNGGGVWKTNPNG
ncbi:MAG TPA: hypothetical protein VKU19_20550 [Bryobacteraceae bacterium]|nr:hypothetical protein [Bryobacteraceae bacterium]